MAFRTECSRRRDPYLDAELRATDNGEKRIYGDARPPMAMFPTMLKMA
jgi:hypothetical protein